MTDNTIIETIRRLIALGSSPNEHEAERAMAKAAELMARHNLAVADVEREINAASQRWVTEDTDWTGRIDFEVRAACDIVTKFFFVKVIREPGHSGKTCIRIFGDPVNVQIGRYVFGYLIETFRVLAWSKRIPRGSRNSYMLGLWTGLTRVLTTEREAICLENAASKNALVLVGNQLAVAFGAAYPRARTARSGRRIRRDDGAYDRGVKDGAQIQIRKGLGGSASPSIGAGQRLIGTY